MILLHSSGSWFAILPARKYYNSEETTIGSTSDPSSYYIKNSNNTIIAPKELATWKS